MSSLTSLCKPANKDLNSFMKNIHQMADDETSKMPLQSFILTPRLILIPTPLAVNNSSYLSLYASLHADASFCEMGFGASFPVKNWTEEETRQTILTRDIARSWQPRNLGDFAVGLRSTAQVDQLTARPIVGTNEKLNVIEEKDEGVISTALGHVEWIGYAGVREATTTSMPSRTGSDPPLPHWLEMIELRYGVAPAYWGKGMAHEAAEAVMQWAGRERGVRRFIAETERENARSARVLEKMGFSQREGVDYWKDEGEIEWERAFVV
jgi:RimJ/RimL family protein N-acetyltransferase